VLEEYVEKHGAYTEPTLTVKTGSISKNEATTQLISLDSLSPPTKKGLKKTLSGGNMLDMINEY
jgi:hypothetical protein